LDSKLQARDDHRLVIDLRIQLKESLEELAVQQFQAVEAASELERCRASRAELQLALEEEKQKIIRMRLASDEMKKVRRMFALQTVPCMNAFFFCFAPSSFADLFSPLVCFRSTDSCYRSHRTTAPLHCLQASNLTSPTTQEATWRRLQAKFADSSKGTVEGGGSHDFLDMSEVGRSGDNTREAAADE